MSIKFVVVPNFLENLQCSHLHLGHEETGAIFVKQCTTPQTAHQAFERILYVYKTENTSIRRLLDGRVLLGTWAGSWM